MHIIENILICSFSHISCRRCIHESRHVDRCVHGCAYILHQSDGDGRGKLHGWKNRGGEREWGTAATPILGKGVHLCPRAPMSGRKKKVDLFAAFDEHTKDWDYGSDDERAEDYHVNRLRSSSTKPRKKKHEERADKKSGRSREPEVKRDAEVDAPIDLTKFDKPKQKRSASFFGGKKSVATKKKSAKIDDRLAERAPSYLNNLEKKVQSMEIKQRNEKKGFLSSAKERIFGTPVQSREPTPELRMNKEQAALKIQAIQRGRSGRRKFQEEQSRQIREEEEGIQLRRRAKAERETRAREAEERNRMFETRRREKTMKKKQAADKHVANTLKARQQKEMRKNANVERARAQEIQARRKANQFYYLSSLFHEFDTSGDGWIDSGELLGLCQRLVPGGAGTTTALPSTAEEMMQVMRLITKKETAVINEAQFADWISWAISLSPDQMSKIAATSPFHAHYVNLAQACLNGFDRLIEQDEMMPSGGSTTFERKRYEPTDYSSRDRAKHLKKVNKEVMEERFRRDEQRRKEKLKWEANHLDSVEQAKREEQMKQKELIDQHKLEKREIARANALRAEAIASYRKEQHRMEQEERDLLAQQIMETRGYDSELHQTVVDSMVASMSSSYPLKKTRNINEYYPTQGEVQDQDKYEEGVVHWLFLSGSDSSVGKKDRADNVLPNAGKQQSNNSLLDSSGDWQDWTESSANNSKDWSGPSISLVQQSGSLMSSQPVAGRGANMPEIQILFLHYSRQGDSSLTDTRMDRLTFLTMVSDLRTPCDRSFLRRFASKSFMKVKRKLSEERGTNGINFDQFVSALVLVGNVVCTSASSIEGFEQLRNEYLRPLAQKVSRSRSARVASLETSPRKKDSVREPTLKKKTIPSSSEKQKVLHYSFTPPENVPRNSRGQQKSPKQRQIREPLLVDGVSKKDMVW